MTEERLREIEAGQCVHDIDDDAGSVMCKACRDRLALIAALRQAWQERDIEAKAALACNDALVRERAALAAAQAERDALKAVGDQMADGILRCIDASWRQGDSIDWTRPELVAILAQENEQ